MYIQYNYANFTFKDGRRQTMITRSEKIDSPYEIKMPKDEFEITKKMYPKWARQGWVFLKNVKRNINKKTRDDIVSSYRYQTVVIALNEQAFKTIKINNIKKMIPEKTLMPIFRKVLENKDLDKLGCSARIKKFRQEEKHQTHIEHDIIL